MKKNDVNIEENALETPVAEKPKKVKKPRKIKNQALLKRGGYAVAITAAVLAGIVVLNVLLGVLAKRIPLEFDMTLDKKNSMSQENIEYIKEVDKEVTVTVCANESDYLMYMTNYAPQMYGVVNGDSSYYDQTIMLINRYDNYNKKIKIRYVHDFLLFIQSRFGKSRNFPYFKVLFILTKSTAKCNPLPRISQVFLC